MMGSCRLTARSQPWAQVQPQGYEWRMIDARLLLVVGHIHLPEYRFHEYRLFCFHQRLRLELLKNFRMFPQTLLPLPADLAA